MYNFTNCPPITKGVLMQFTITDCISRINQALNYPALAYEDVYHFFDQAIAELNTSLRIGLPLVTEMRNEHTFQISDSSNCIYIPDGTVPTSATVVTSKPISAPEEGKLPVVFYVDSTKALNSTFYIYRNGEWHSADVVYGIKPDRSAFQLIRIGNTAAAWVQVPYNHLKDFSLTEYLPTDWIVLFIIPYVCFKFSVRNGDNGALFSDEFTQGFQQLQTSYSVPNTVELATVAHLPAYSNIVKENLNDLRKNVTTRAITEDMRVRNGIQKVNGVSVYDHGGWGI